MAEVHSEIAETAHDEIVEFAKAHDVEWTVVGPEQPLTEGLGDKLRQAGVKVFGPGEKQRKLKVLNHLQNVLWKIWYSNCRICRSRF